MSVTSVSGGPVPAEASRRERKKAATRAALRRAAVELVGQRGLAGVTVDDIAERADVSTRTFFNYFATKEDAVTGWDPAVLTDMCDRLRDRPAGEGPPAAMRAVMTQVLAEFDADPEDLLTRLAVIRSDPHLTAYHAARWTETERHLVAVVAERRGGDPAGDRYDRLVVAATLLAGRVAMMSWCDHRGRYPLLAEFTACVDILASGLAEPDRAGR